MGNCLWWITRIQAEWAANDHESGGEAGFAAIRVSFFFIRVGLEAFRWVDCILIILLDTQSGHSP
jgi:hypothetical protein